MKVAKLIEELKKLNKDKDICIRKDYYGNMTYEENINIYKSKKIESGNIKNEIYVLDRG